MAGSKDDDFLKSPSALRLSGLYCPLCHFGNIRAASAVQKLGLDDEAVLEILSVVDLLRGYNTLMDGLRVEADEKPWYG